VLGQQVPFGKLRAGSHRAYRPIRNDIDFAFSLASPSLAFSSLDFNGATVRTNFERFTSCLPAVCFSQALTWKSNSSRVRRARSHQRCNLPMGKADRTASIAVRKWKASSYEPPRTKKRKTGYHKASSEVCRMPYRTMVCVKLNGSKRRLKEKDLWKPPDAGATASTFPLYGVCSIEWGSCDLKTSGMVFTRRLEDRIRLLLFRATNAENGDVKPILSALRSALHEHNSRLRALASRKLVPTKAAGLWKRRNEPLR
jgi:hypothetical protein